ncbi:hypothetical protein F5X99DRAFT_333902 [Biscogniauxia marginata]|nr:hypothetical protein F5X99DRAFT_333902 [Biscogniauxia marginata]
MEMIENGSLRDFVVRARNWGYPIPNRLLLRFFMCLVQFCIAMAWPPKGRRGARPRRERIPGNEEERNRKYQMRHNDMHLRNILIGDIDPNDGRHDDVPILKLIDFDRAQLFADPEGQDLGVKWNIFEIGTIMRSLITQNLPLPPNPLDVVITLEDGTQRTINSYGGDINTVGYPNLDPELGMIVIQCMTTTVEQVPNLEDLYETIRNLNATRTGAYYQNYPRWQHETNDAMKRIVQALIMDADN